MTDGQLAAGERLPATRALTATLGVSRTVATAAYAQLFAEGWIEGRHGSGTYVADGLAGIDGLAGTDGLAVAGGRGVAGGRAGAGHAGAGHAGAGRAGPMPAAPEGGPSGAAP